MLRSDRYGAGWALETNKRLSSLTSADFASALAVVMNLLGLATHVLRRGYLRARNGCLVRRAVCRNPGITVGSHVKIEPNDLRLFRASRGTMIKDFAQITVWGPDPFSPGPGGRHLGEIVLICSFANVIATCGEIVIEEYGMIAQHVSLIAANHSLATNQWYRWQPCACFPSFHPASCSPFSPRFSGC